MDTPAPPCAAALTDRYSVRVGGRAREAIPATPCPCRVVGVDCPAMVPPPRLGAAASQRLRVPRRRAETCLAARRRPPRDEARRLLVPRVARASPPKRSRSTLFAATAPSTPTCAAALARQRELAAVHGSGSSGGALPPAAATATPAVASSREASEPAAESAWPSLPQPLCLSTSLSPRLPAAAPPRHRGDAARGCASPSVSLTPLATPQRVATAPQAELERPSPPPRDCPAMVPPRRPAPFAAAASQRSCVPPLGAAGAETCRVARRRPPRRGPRSSRSRVAAGLG